MTEYFSLLLLGGYGLVLFVFGLLWDAKQHQRHVAEAHGTVPAGGGTPYRWAKGELRLAYDRGQEEAKKTRFFGELLHSLEDVVGTIVQRESEEHQAYEAGYHDAKDEARHGKEK
jgi:hypothetical protein